MGSTADWFAKKMGQQPQVVVRQTQPQYPPVAIPHVPQAVQNSQPIQTQNGVLDPSAPATAQYHVGDAIAVWGGNPNGGLSETLHCPQCVAKHCACGGNKLFQRKNAMKRGHPPAPLCDCCGFNGLFEQFGATEG